jgi:hypothetical protein
MLGLGGTHDRQQRLLIVRIKRTDREMLGASAVHQLAGPPDIAGHIHSLALTPRSSPASWSHERNREGWVLPVRQ